MFFYKLICGCVGKIPQRYERLVDKTIQSKIDMVKLLRVYGGCLGVERR